MTSYNSKRFLLFCASTFVKSLDTTGQLDLLLASSVDILSSGFGAPTLFFLLLLQDCHWEEPQDWEKFGQLHGFVTGYK